MSSNTCWKPGLYCCNLAPESSSTVFKHDLRLYVREVGEGIFRTLNRIWNLSIAVQAARSHIWPMLTTSALKSFQQSSSDISFKLIQQLYHLSKFEANYSLFGEDRLSKTDHRKTLDQDVKRGLGPSALSRWRLQGR